MGHPIKRTSDSAQQAILRNQTLGPSDPYLHSKHQEEGALREAEKCNGWHDDVTWFRPVVVDPWIGPDFDSWGTTERRPDRLLHLATDQPLAHRPGEGQVDFGYALAKLGGRLCKVAFFVMALPYSDAFFVQAFERECTETFWEGSSPSIHARYPPAECPPR